MRMQCLGWPWFYGCFQLRRRQVGGVSLNRCEQTIYDFVNSHSDERQYWQHKVRNILADSVETPAAVARIASELWRYYEERSAVMPSFGGIERASEIRRTSTKNLAELLIRLWAEPQSGRPAPALPDARP
jgi:hypothetical protein